MRATAGVTAGLIGVFIVAFIAILLWGGSSNAKGLEALVACAIFVAAWNLMNRRGAARKAAKPGK